MAESEVKETVRLWVPHDKDVWQLLVVENQEADVSLDDPDEVVVITDRGEKRSVLIKDTHALDPTHLLNLNDLCGMSNLHEAPLLDMLRRRTINDQIYTNTGSVLISVNPYKLIPGLYDNPLSYYLPSEASEAIAAMPPHVYKIANGAYMSIANNERQNQSVIVSGESGAGKTEASKHVMNFLIAVNEADLIKSEKKKTNSPRPFAGSITTGAGEHIKRVLLDSNNILESFGNSKTVRNDNSSRFGKYIRLQYTQNKVLVSAYTETFLLEKSRLTNGTKSSASVVDSGERNYHVLYGMFVGSDSTVSLAALGLDVGYDKFAILCAPGANVIQHDDAQNFELLCSSMRELGVSNAEMEAIWGLLATILHLGNAEVKTMDVPGTDGSIAQASTHFPTSTLEKIADSFGVTASAFTQAMTIHLVQLGRRGSITRKILSAEEVSNNINALMKWIYSGLFNWLVKKINFAHCGHASNSAAKMDPDPAVNFIGILDIFGFEILKTNSFEQLCINFTNERLQQQFNERVFVYEQLEYEKEGLNWSTISFKDNQNVIDLICKKPSGLLNLLEEHGLMNRKPDDKALLTSFDQMHNTKHPCYHKPRFGNDSFIVAHFAGNVTYTIAGFLEKNNDTLQEDLLTLMDSSKNKFLLRIMNIETPDESQTDTSLPGYIPPIPDHLIVRVVDDTAMLEDVPDPGNVKASSLRHSSSLMSSALGSGGGRVGKKMASTLTVSFHFRHQLDDLMSTLRATHPHYIKCIKPNTQKSPNSLMPSIVMEQLRYSGILEVVRIRREGYPTRTPFQDFYAMFEILGAGGGRKAWSYPTPAACSLEQAKAAAEAIATAVFKDDPLFFQIGHSKIFLKDGGLDLLRLAVKNFYADRARIIQRRFLTRRQARWFQDLRLSAVDIQKSVRCWMHSKRFIRIMRAVKVIQWAVVGKRLRKDFILRCHMATIIRRRVRVYLTRSLFRIKKQLHLKAIRVIQRVYRGSISRKSTRKKRLDYIRAQILISRVYRGHRQVIEYQSVLGRLIILQACARKILARRIAKKRLICCCFLQARVRSFVHRNRFRAIVRKVILLQSILRMVHSQKRFQYDKRRVIAAQAITRRLISGRQYRNALSKCVRIQCLIRRAMQRIRYLGVRTKLILIQSALRMAIFRRRFEKDRERVILVQALVRRHLSIGRYTNALSKCVRIQCLIRRAMQRIRYLGVRTKLILIQSALRMAIFRRRFEKDRERVILVQALVRRHLSIGHYRRIRRNCVSIQKQFRGKIARNYYRGSREKIIRIQNSIRMALAFKRYNQAMLCVVCIQSVLRGRLSRISYRKTIKRCTRIQALVRQAVYKMRYSKTRASIIKLQTFARSATQRGKYKSLLKSLILIQAVARRKSCMNSFRFIRQNWISVQKNVRRFLLTLRLFRMKNAIKRLKVCARRFLRNLDLQKRIVRLHGYCQSGDVDAVKDHLSTEYFTDLAVRNKWGTYQTCLHTACQFGQLGVIELLQPTQHEILQKDINGNTALHHAAMLPNIEVVKALEKRLVMTISNIAESTTAAADHDNKATEAVGGGADSEDEDGATLLAHLDLGDKIKEGYLKKVSKGRWGTRQQKRWVELHEEHLVYFKNKGDKVPRGTIPVSGAVVKRHPAASSKEGPSFEIFSEEISLKKKKENASLLFVMDNEKELQEWLIPLKVLVGIDNAFRTTSPVTYVNSVLKDAWLTEVNAFGETPLHIAARFYNGACPFIRTQTVERPVPVNNPSIDGRIPSTPKRDVKSRLNTLEPVLLSPFRPQVPLVRVLQLCMWLIESGCHIDATNLDGQTALHLAVQHRNTELVRCLVRKGADVDIRDRNRSTPEYFANGTTLNALKEAIVALKAEQHSTVSFSPLLHRPIQISGYSYLSIHFMKHSLAAQFADTLNFMSCGFEFFLSISVVNRDNELVEANQDIRAPGIVRDSYLWWACTWNMQTPIENLDSDCSVKIELYKVNKAAADAPPPAPALIPVRRRSQTGMAAVAESEAQSGPVLVSVAVYAIDFLTLDSGVVNVAFLTPNGGDTPDHSFISADFMLLKRSKSMTLDKFRKQVYTSDPRMIWFSRNSSNYNTEGWDGSFPPATSTSDDTCAIVSSEVDSMGVKDLKKHLAALNVNMAGLLEVSEFRQALKNAIEPA